MTYVPTRWLVAVGLAALLAAPPAEAEAGRVVVLEIEGARSAKLRNQVVGMVRGEHSLVPRRRYHATARKIRARSKRPRDVARVSKRLDVDAVLEGTLIRRRDGRRLLRLRLRSGDHGRAVKKWTIAVHRGAIGPRTTRKLAARIDLAIDKTGSPSRGQRDRRIATKKQRQQKLAEQRRERRLAKQRQIEERRRIAKERRRQRIERKKQLAEKRRQERIVKRKQVAIKKRLVKYGRLSKKKKKERLAEAKEREREEREARERRRAKLRVKREKEREQRRKEREEALLRVDYDDTGEVVDDEVPDILRGN